MFNPKTPYQIPRNTTSFLTPVRTLKRRRTPSVALNRSPLRSNMSPELSKQPKRLRVISPYKVSLALKRKHSPDSSYRSYTSPSLQRKKFKQMYVKKTDNISNPSETLNIIASEEEKKSLEQDFGKLKIKDNNDMELTDDDELKDDVVARMTDINVLKQKINAVKYIQSELLFPFKLFHANLTYDDQVLIQFVNMKNNLDEPQESHIVMIEDLIKLLNDKNKFNKLIEELQIFIQDNIIGLTNNTFLLLYGLDGLHEFQKSIQEFFHMR